MSKMFLYSHITSQQWISETWDLKRKPADLDSVYNVLSQWVNFEQMLQN